MELRNLRMHYPPLLRFVEANSRVVKPGNGNQSNVRERLKQNLIKKSMLLLVALFIFTSVVLKAQSPQKINFQSIVRNTSGVIVSNKSVNFKITILSGSTTGTPVYSETHLKTTDAIGLVSLQIGTGTVSNGVFSSLNWGNASHFIKLEADFTGGNTYVTLGTQELMSVPYAMYAAKTDTNSLNLTNRLADKAPVNNPTFTGTVGGITKAMVVGLGNVDNTSDVDKPVSSATQAALNAKAPLASPTFTGTVSGITKAMVVGLGNVDNTSDLSKPVSTATQTALNAKVNTLDTASMLSKYLRKADFPSGSSANEILYWNGTNWVSLSPGTTGQVLTMSSTGLSWGCIVTNSAASPSNVTLVATTPLTPITIATTGATGIDLATGLPAGVTAVWLNDVITISGTPTAAGTFNYTIPLTGGCGTVSATGIITVNPVPCPATITYNSYPYKAVEIGTQCWMAENLRTRKYNDGADIPFDASGGTSGNGSDQTWGALRYGAHTIYNHDSTAITGKLAIYGYLYNWYAVNDSRKLCPGGWHVPTGSDWNKLVISIDPGADTISRIPKIQSTTAGTILKSTATGGFSALLGGFRSPDDNNKGKFNSINDGAFYWSASEVSTGGEYRYLFSGNDGNVLKTGGAKPVGMSVRCLRD